MAVDKTRVIDNSNIELLAQQIFQIVENNYIRRTEYEAAINDLSERIFALEAIYLYQFTLQSDGDLTMVIPESEDPSVSLEVNDDGYLILSMDEGVTSALEAFSFDINEDDDLIVSIQSS